MSTKEKCVRGEGAETHCVSIYTDGAAAPTNPGPGGYGVVLLSSGRGPIEISGGFWRTTNNRMELTAAIVGLEILEECTRVTVFSDSAYLVNSMEKGWARSWQESNWSRSKGRTVPNSDLWIRLLRLGLIHDVTFVWIKGHAGDRYNERCDALAAQGARKPDRAPDKGFENPESVEIVRAGQECPVCWSSVALKLQVKSRRKNKTLPESDPRLYCPTCDVKYKIPPESISSSA